MWFIHQRVCFGLPCKHKSCCTHDRSFKFDNNRTGAAQASHISAVERFQSVNAGELIRVAYCFFRLHTVSQKNKSGISNSICLPKPLISNANAVGVSHIFSVVSISTSPIEFHFRPQKTLIFVCMIPITCVKANRFRARIARADEA